MFEKNTLQFKIMITIIQSILFVLTAFIASNLKHSLLFIIFMLLGVFICSYTFIMKKFKRDLSLIISVVFTVFYAILYWLITNQLSNIWIQMLMIFIFIIFLFYSLINISYKLIEKKYVVQGMIDVSSKANIVTKQILHGIIIVLIMWVYFLSLIINEFDSNTFYGGQVWYSLFIVLVTIIALYFIIQVNLQLLEKDNIYINKHEYNEVKFLSSEISKGLTGLSAKMLLAVSKIEKDVYVKEKNIFNIKTEIKDLELRIDDRKRKIYDTNFYLKEEALNKEIEMLNKQIPNYNQEEKEYTIALNNLKPYNDKYQSLLEQRNNLEKDLNNNENEEQELVIGKKLDECNNELRVLEVERNKMNEIMIEKKHQYDLIKMQKEKIEDKIKEIQNQLNRLNNDLNLMINEDSEIQSSLTLIDRRNKDYEYYEMLVNKIEHLEKNSDSIINKNYPNDLDKQTYIESKLNDLPEYNNVYQDLLDKIKDLEIRVANIKRGSKKLGDIGNESNN